MCGSGWKCSTAIRRASAWRAVPAAGPWSLSRFPWCWPTACRHAGRWSARSAQLSFGAVSKPEDLLFANAAPRPAKTAMPLAKILQELFVVVGCSGKHRLWFRRVFPFSAAAEQPPRLKRREARGEIADEAEEWNIVPPHTDADEKREKYKMREDRRADGQRQSFSALAGEDKEREIEMVGD